MKNKEQIEQLDLRIFRAVDEPELTLDFSIAFVDHFNASGIAAVTSTQIDWMDDPHVFVLGFYKGDKPVAGARLHLANPDYEYPLTSALKTVDIDVNSFIDDLYVGNHAEACGLWISNRYKGLGIMQFMCGGLLTLGRSLQLDKVYAICPRHTLDSLRRLGYLVRFDGNEVIKFEYPSREFISYLIESDVATMSFAARKEKRIMDGQLTKPTGIHSTRGRMGDLLIQMHGVPDLQPLSFSHRETKRGSSPILPRKKSIAKSTSRVKIRVDQANNDDNQ